MKVLVLAALAVIGYGQSFEVASIRLNREPFPTLGTSIEGTRVTGTLSIYSLITSAYNLQPYAVTGISPPAMDAKEFYDISARAPGGQPPTAKQVRKMFQSLLVDRFQLKFHRETRETNVYSLVVAKSGPKLRDSAAAGYSMTLNDKGTTFKGASMPKLAQHLSNEPGIDRPVFDNTELPGTYDFQLNYAGNPKDGLTGPSGESIFTAIEEQLGLKLERQKAPIEVLLVDSVQKPSEN